MLKNIRRMVFETNSSSSHSLSIVGANNMALPRDNTPRNVTVIPGEYGWGYERLDDVWSRLGYIVTAIQYHDEQICPHIYSDNKDAVVIENSHYFKWLSEMTQDYIGWTLIYEKSDDQWYPHGYIDHLSVGLLEDYFVEDEAKFKENMRDIIFNDKYDIIIDNDNH